MARRNPPERGNAEGFYNGEGPRGETASVAARTGHTVSTFVVSTKNADGDAGVEIPRRRDSTPFAQPLANTVNRFHDRLLARLDQTIN